jgi:anthranilate synthase component 1
VRPIAGTRAAPPKKPIWRWKDLLSDDKEIAEHLMLIDLGRNDTGRVSKSAGEAHREDGHRALFQRDAHRLQRHRPTESRADGDGRAAGDSAGGHLVGAPKIRAMEIIDELEPVKRVYGGAVGYFAWNGNMDTAIAIRTAVIKDGELHVQAGGGIVADSVPALEWEETLNKRRAMFRAVALAEQTRTPDPHCLLWERACSRSGRASRYRCWLMPSPASRPAPTWALWSGIKTRTPVRGPRFCTRQPL